MAPATANAKGPVTSRAESRQSTRPSYRLAPMSAMKTNVTELPESRVRVEAEVPGEEVERRVQQAAKKLGQQLRIPGFRKGKVPPTVVIRRLGREAVLDEALRSSLGSWYVEAIDGAGIAPIGEPDLDVGDLPAEGQPLAFSIEIGVRPEAKLGTYKGLEVGRREPQADDAAVEAEIERLRDRVATLDTVERAAETGDHVVVDYVGKIDGEPFAGGEGRDQLIELGSERLIPGFEEQLVGASRRRRAHGRGDLPGGLSRMISAARRPPSTSPSPRSRPSACPSSTTSSPWRRAALTRWPSCARTSPPACVKPTRRPIEREFEEAVLQAASDAAEIDLPDQLVHARAHEVR